MPTVNAESLSLLGLLFLERGLGWGVEVVRVDPRESLSWGSGPGNCAAVCLNNLSVIGLFEMPKIFGKVGEGRQLALGRVTNRDFDGVAGWVVVTLLIAKPVGRVALPA